MTRFDWTAVAPAVVPLVSVAVIVVALAAAVSAAVVLLSGQSDTRGSLRGQDDAVPPGPPRTPVRGCRKRMEAPRRIQPHGRRDTIIGPIAFAELARAYREQASSPDSELEPFPGVWMPAIKDIAVLRAGARVTLVVPVEQRSWMKLIYGAASPWRECNNHAGLSPARVARGTAARVRLASAG